MSRLAFLLSLAVGVSAKTPVIVPGWPALPYPFSTALVSFGGALHISGMQGVDFSASPPARVTGGAYNETVYIMKNMAEVMKAARGASMSDILECMVFLRDIKADFEHMNMAYKAAFTDGVFPARVASQAELAGGAAVEIKCTGDVSQYYQRELQSGKPQQPMADVAA